MSAVRPEFGPTLPEVLAPLPRPLRVGLAALAALLVVAFVVTRFTSGEDRTEVLVREPITFNFVHDAGLRRVAPEGGEVVRLTGKGELFAVSPVTLPPFRGDISGITPIFTEGLVGAMETRYEGFLRRMEGRVNINKQQGYELVFQFRERGRTRYGRRVLLFPTPVSREGIDVLLLGDRTAAVPRADAIGRSGGLKVALRSLRFGTDRP